MNDNDKRRILQLSKDENESLDSIAKKTGFHRETVKAVIKKDMEEKTQQYGSERRFYSNG